MLSKHNKRIFIVIVAIALFYMLYVKLIVEKFDSKPKVTIIMFYAAWCHFCKSYRKSNTFMNTYETSIHNKDDISFMEYDYDLHKHLGEKYEVSSFPTILSIDEHGNKIDEFSGDRNSGIQLVNFANQSIQSIKN